MTAKHFRTVAASLKSLHSQQKPNVFYLQSLCGAFLELNPRFNPMEFLLASGLTIQESAPIAQSLNYK